MTEERKSEKLRLNITVDKEVAEQAKDMGFNISGAFEEYLRVLTYRPQGNTGKDVIKAYDSFLEEIKKVLALYEIEIEIGEVTKKDHIQTKKGHIDYYGSKIVLDPYNVYYLKNDKYYASGALGGEEEYEFDYFEPKDIEFFYEPKQILQNLMGAVKRASVNNPAIIQKLNIGKKIVNALFSNDENSSESGIETPLFRRILEDVEKTKSAQITDSVENKEIIA